MSINMIERRSSDYKYVKILSHSVGSIGAPQDSVYSLMERKPSWEAANCAANQELPSIYGNRKFITMFTRTVPILNQINPICTILSYLSKIHFNIVHPPTLWYS
jgi:hypothetical protein